MPLVGSSNLSPPTIFETAAWKADTHAKFRSEEKRLDEHYQAGSRKTDRECQRVLP